MTVAAGAIVDHAILDENVRVGANAVIGRKTERASGKPITSDDLALVGQNVVLPPGAHLPPGSRTPPA